MTREFVLRNCGETVLVDDEDYERVMQYNWVKDRNGYVVRTIKTKNGDSVTKQKIMLHRFILDAPIGSEIDHINHNPLDNRRVNLRFVTRSQNATNQRGLRQGTSPFKGVAWRKKYKTWAASIKSDGKTRHIGTFGNEIDAALAYDKAAFAAWGEYAYLNFPSEIIAE